jgi:hypothetical protein
MWRGRAVSDRAESRTEPVRSRASDWSGAGLAREIAERWQLSADAVRPALAKGECPLCRMLVQATDDLTDLLLRAEEIPGSMCDETREARGFCGIHAWRLLEAGAARGLPAMGVVRPVRDVLAHALSALALYGRRCSSEPPGTAGPSGWPGGSSPVGSVRCVWL